MLMSRWFMMFVKSLGSWEPGSLPCLKYLLGQTKAFEENSILGIKQRGNRE
jgi:hypothetical protein